MAKYRLQSWQNHNYKLIWNQDALLNTSLFQENAKIPFWILSVFIAGHLMVFARCYPGLIIPTLSLSKRRTVPRGRCKDAITQKISQRGIWTGTWAPGRRMELVGSILLCLDWVSRAERIRIQLCSKMSHGTAGLAKGTMDEGSAPFPLPLDPSSGSKMMMLADVWSGKIVAARQQVNVQLGDLLGC